MLYSFSITDPKVLVHIFALTDMFRLTVSLEVLEKMLDIQIVDSEQEKKDKLSVLSKEELIEQLLKTKAS